ncbi:pseudouridine synthase [Marinobacter caseinilyticus]|uniref:pseudouridine synthase n=1 Tax=Marinobacter caseinilyticus TaxID=2692195 RepID=UPI00140CD8C7|nr:pseudouridine synthase [Marinobacter caseinilyticus]
MATLVILNKPFNVLCQFTDDQGRETLSHYVDRSGVYPAGRLDFDSEGLVLLTDDGQLQQQIAAPRHKMTKTYWVQVEGDITDQALRWLETGVELKDGLTRPASAARMATPTLWPRNPPVRERKAIPTSWLQLSIKEGRNRQVRRMTAAVGFPTLRLVRYRIGDWTLDGLAPGASRMLELHLPKATTDTQRSRRLERSNKQTSKRKPR